MINLDIQAEQPVITIDTSSLEGQAFEVKQISPSLMRFLAENNFQEKIGATPDGTQVSYEIDGGYGCVLSVKIRQGIYRWLFAENGANLSLAREAFLNLIRGQTMQVDEWDSKSYLDVPNDLGRD